MSNLYASGGTALYRAVTLGLQRLSSRRASDSASGIDCN